MPKLVAAEIEHSLRRRIGSGEWSETRRLPNERELAAEYKVARNTVRSAIDKIAADGSVTREVGRGTFLRHDVNLDFMAIIQKLNGVSPIDMMAVRQIFEPRVAALTATNASAGDLRDIAEAHSAAVEAVEMATFEHWDAELHQRIFAGSRNELLNHLHQFLRLIRSQDQWLDIKRRSFSPARRQVYCQEHAAIVEALMRRDAEAASNAMRAHLDTVGRNLFGGAGFA
jgi:DNA-binding FadR family transcriptional regulator